MSNVHILEKKLRDAGQSYTKARQLVFTALDGQEPMSMSELVSRVGTSVDRASVYRTVKLFDELGIVHKLQIGWKYKLELSDDFHEHHHHIACVKCGSIWSVHDNHEFEESIHKVAQENYFQLLSHQLELRGVCSSCQNA